MYPIDSWFVVLEAKQLRRNGPLAAKRFGLDLALWRDADGEVRCVSDRCPHRGAALSAGEVRDGLIECPFHGFRFDGAGACVKVPCNGPDGQRPRHLDTRSFVVREAHGLIWLWWGEARERYPDPPWFDELGAGWEHSSFWLDAAVGWERAVENQLDFAHLPFVHGNTIGAGYPESIEVRCTLEGDRLTAWAAHDEGFRISFLFPNIWTNPLGGGRVRGFGAFVPIDETHSRLYMRTYVRRLPIPGLARLGASTLDLFNRVILRQDMRVLHTQPPTVVAGEDKLVQADLPVARFRKELRRRSRPGIETIGAREPARALEQTGS